MNYTITEIATIVKAQKRAYKDYTITALLPTAVLSRFQRRLCFSLWLPNETTVTVTSKISTEKEYETSWWNIG